MKKIIISEFKKIIFVHIAFFMTFFIMLYLRGWHVAVTFLFTPFLFMLSSFHRILSKLKDE